MGLAALVALGPCNGGRIASDGAPARSVLPDAGADASTSEDSSAPHPEAGCPQAGAGCNITPGPAPSLPTAADFQALFSRRWLTCGNKFTTRSDEAGFAAAADGTYTMLLYDPSGAIVNGPSATYEIVPNFPPVWQVNFYPGPQGIFPGAERITLVNVTDAPYVLDVADNGAIFWHFVAADPWPADAGDACP